MSVNHSVVPALTRAQLLDIHQWTANQERTRAEYERRNDTLAALETETPCHQCSTGHHDHCNGRTGPARGNRCLCWEMWHPGSATTTTGDAS